MDKDIIIKVKSGGSKKSIENFGNNRYLIRTDLLNHKEVNKEVIVMISKYMGIPENRFFMKSGLESEDKIVQLVM